MGATTMAFRGEETANQFERLWSDDSAANSYFLLHTKGTYEIKISDVRLFIKNEFFSTAPRAVAHPESEALRMQNRGSAKSSCFFSNTLPNFFMTIHLKSET